MATITLEFKFRVGGVLTNATSVVLRDATHSYGVVRTDTAEVIVPANTAMTNPATGVYRYELTTPAAGLTYSWVAEVVYDGATYHFENETTDSALDTSHYANQADIELWQGAGNVATYSNVSGTRTLNEDRLEAALTRADAQINAALRRRGYATPLESSSADYSLIKDIAARLALYWLYSPRESRDDSEMTDGSGAIIKANTWRRRAIDELNQLLLNGIDGDRLTDAPTVPTAVE